MGRFLGRVFRSTNICLTFVPTDPTGTTFENPERRSWIEGKITLAAEDLTAGHCGLACLVTDHRDGVEGGWRLDRRIAKTVQGRRISQAGLVGPATLDAYS